MLAAEIDALREAELAAMSRSGGAPAFSVAAHADLARRVRAYVALVVERNGDVSDTETLLPHVLHFVRVAPFLRAASSLGVVRPSDPRHAELREAWSEGLRGEVDRWTLSNAFEFYEEFDLPSAANVLDRLTAMLPSDPEVNLQAGRFELTRCELGDPAGSYHRALAHFQAARDASSLALLAPGAAAIAAFETGDHALALRCATDALERESYGFNNLAHAGSTVMGLLALHEGDAGAAVSWLRRSGQLRLSHGGPSLRLARELARRGHVQEVRNFLVATREAWEGPVARCDEWLRLLERGEYEGMVNPGR